ncbi:Bfr1 protein [Scheffersomyces coipomensis]|uniref:Bfr1 protein n=1 Tax=Scheffersomyces coipomensis TaxID=1788519 RepID=UPI00315D4935
MSTSTKSNGSSSTTNANSGFTGKFFKRPDDKALKSQIDSIRNEIKKLDLSNDELNAQINKSQIDSSTNEKRNDLQSQLKTLVSKQSTIKNERNLINDQIKNIDTQLKKKITEIQLQTSKNQFKSVDEIDKRIAYLDKLIGNGDLKLADERRFVKEMSSLRKLKKDFGQIEKIQALIDLDKEKIQDLKKKLNSIGQPKELATQYDQIQAELDAINNANKSVFAKKNDLIKKRNDIRKQKDEKYDQIRSLRTAFDEDFAKFKKNVADEKKKREEENKLKYQQERQSRLKEEADKQLSEASIPAFQTEINSIHNLLSHFDPSYTKPSATTTKTDNLSTTSATTRTIEMPADMVVLKKDREDFFKGAKKIGGTGSKKKSQKKFTVDPEIIVALSDLSIPFPTKEDDVPQTITILKETLTALSAKQDEQTKLNIEKAQARIAKLEAEAEKEDAEEAATKTETEPVEESKEEEVEAVAEETPVETED